MIFKFSNGYFSYFLLLLYLVLLNNGYKQNFCNSLFWRLIEILFAINCMVCFCKYFMKTRKHSLYGCSRHFSIYSWNQVPWLYYYLDLTFLCLVQSSIPELKEIYQNLLLWFSCFWKVLKVFPSSFVLWLMNMYILRIISFVIGGIVSIKFFCQ